MTDVPAELAPFVGLPHLPGGDALEGIDCQGLCALVYRELGRPPLPRYIGPRDGQDADLAAAAVAYSRHFQRVAVGRERYLDGILWRVAGYPIHLALVAAPGRMLHVEEGGESVIVPYPSLAWPSSRIVGIYRPI